MMRGSVNKGPRNDGESGQMLVMAALAMTLVLAFAALTIDVGSLTQERRDIQNDADAMALAGASQIKASGTGNSAAEAIARTWATKNSVANSEIIGITFGTTCSGESVANTITVRLQREQPTFLFRILGVDEADVGACATAARYSAGGGIGMAPFGVEDDCVYGPDGLANTDDAGEMNSGSVITIKYDSQNDDGVGCGSNTGNFWTLAIDESGAGENCGSPIPGDEETRKLKEAICFGAITPLCTPAVAALGEDCETSVDTQTGNQVGGVRSSVVYLVDNVPDACDTLAEIVTPVTIAGQTRYTLTNQCNPYLPGYVGVSLVKMIPVLNGLYPDANGKSNVPIVDFLIVVIDPAQVNSGWCQGNNCDLQAMIVDVAVNPLAYRKGLNDSSLNNLSVLVN